MIQDNRRVWELLCSTKENKCPNRAWSTCRRAVYHLLRRAANPNADTMADGIDHGRQYRSVCKMYIAVDDEKWQETPVWWGRRA